MKYHSENFNGVYDFRCRFHNGYFVEQHLHEYSEILYCHKGVCEVYINGCCTELTEGNFIWLPPNYVHQYKCTFGEVICAVFSNDFIPLYFHATKGRRLIVNPLPAEELKDIFCTLPNTDCLSITQICGYLNLTADKVLKSSEFSDGKQSDGILYQKVISYLSEHFKEDITLAKLAEMFNYNEKYLSHCLHTLTNIHFSEFLAMYRIEYAKKLLESDPSLSITEIALECGFGATNTFNRMFKKITGVTPGKYKKL